MIRKVLLEFLSILGEKKKPKNKTKKPSFVHFMALKRYSVLAH